VDRNGEPLTGPESDEALRDLVESVDIDAPEGSPTGQMAWHYAMEIKADRAKHLPWRKIAEELSISRIEAIRLAHSLDEVLDEIREAAPAGTVEAVHNQV
jgi:hypothetical protein